MTDKDKRVIRGSNGWQVLELVNKHPEGITAADMAFILRWNRDRVGRRASDLLVNGLIAGSPDKPKLYGPLGTVFKPRTLAQLDSLERTFAAKVRNVMRQYSEVDSQEIASQLRSNIHMVGHALRECREMGVAESRLDDGRYLWRMTDGSAPRSRRMPTSVGKEHPKDIAARQRLDMALPVKTRIRKDGVKVTTCETGKDYRYTVHKPERYFSSMKPGQYMPDESWAKTLTEGKA